MAGQLADGVFIRMGIHPDKQSNEIEQVHLGAKDVGRQLSDVNFVAIFQTMLDDNKVRCSLIPRSTATGYFAHENSLFQNACLEWDGPSTRELKSIVWPDFHHSSDLEQAAQEESFLSDDAADSFALNSSISKITDLVLDVLSGELSINFVILHPTSTSRTGSNLTQYSDILANMLSPKVK